MLNYNLSTILAHIIISFIGTIILGVIGLPLLKKIKAGQHIREEGPQSHQAKTGTPTMGGWFFILSILIVGISSNYLMSGTPESLWFYFTALLMYALIGFVDDFLKIILKRNLGLTSWQKIFLQIASVVVLFLFFNERFSSPSINFIFWQLPVPLIIYVMFAVFWFVGFSNATNVTDGLDGLLTMTAMIAFTTFGIIAFMRSNLGTATFCFIVLGALIGFLVFNRHPAKVFMGDTGSLAIGALLAAISLEMRMEFYLLPVGIVFVLETLSVMLQVAYFKYTKHKEGVGRRIFLMSPFHHHLELKGVPETHIVFFLSILGILGGCVAIGLTYILY